MKRKRLITYKRALALTAVAQAAFVSRAFARTPESAADVVIVLKRILFQLGLIFTALAAVVLIYAAFVYLTAGGNQGRIDTAKKTLLWAIAAIILATIAGGIPLVIDALLQV